MIKETCAPPNVRYETLKQIVHIVQVTLTRTLTLTLTLTPTLTPTPAILLTYTLPDIIASEQVQSGLAP